MFVKQNSSRTIVTLDAIFIFILKQFSDEAKFQGYSQVSLIFNSDPVNLAQYVA